MKYNNCIVCTPFISSPPPPFIWRVYQSYRPIQIPSYGCYNDIKTTRTWSHSTFKAALNNNRTDEEKEKILKQFWCNYEDLVAREPEKHGMDYVHSYLVIEKL